MKAAGLVIAWASAAAAQSSDLAIRVRVADSASAPIANAEIKVMRGIATLLAVGTTDSTGGRRLSVPRGSGEVEVVVRRLGYQRRAQFVHAEADSIDLEVRLVQAPQTLAAVRVTAREDLNRKRYHLSADDIAGSTRLIIDGLDVVSKLRPDMIDPPGAGFYTSCGLYSIWINGRRIIDPPIDDGLAAKASMLRRGAQLAASPGRPPHYYGVMNVPIGVQSVLAKLHAEHIEEMTYVSCRDTKSPERLHGQNALFIVLKQGVSFDEYRGSFVPDAKKR